MVQASRCDICWITQNQREPGRKRYVHEKGENRLLDYHFRLCRAGYLSKQRVFHVEKPDDSESWLFLL